MMAISRVTLLSIFWLTTSIIFWYYIKRLDDDDFGVLRLLKEWVARRDTKGTWEDWVDWMGNVHIWGVNFWIGMLALQRSNNYLLIFSFLAQACYLQRHQLVILINAMFETFLELFPFFAFMRYAELS